MSRKPRVVLNPRALPERLKHLGYAIPEPPETPRKRCSRCKRELLITEFYRRTDGRPGTRCIVCEKKRREENAAAKSGAGRLKAIRSGEIGRTTKISDEQKRLVLRVYAETNNKTAAARRAGVSRGSAKKIIEANQSKLLDVAAPPEPRGLANLTKHAREALDDPEAFASRYVKDPSSGNPILLAPWAAEAMRELLALYHSDSDEYVILNAGPGSGKSTVMYVFVAWVVVRERTLGREPTIHLGHRSEGKAKWYLRRLAHLFTHNRDLIEDFGRFRPEARGSVWSREELLIEPLRWDSLLQKEPTISVGSYDKGELSGRYRLIIWDDLIDKSNSLNADQRKKLEEWWETEAESRLEPGGLLVLSNARYGPQDLSWTLRQQKDTEETDEAGAARPLYRHIAYKAHYPERCDGESHSGPYPQGCLLDPRRLSWPRVRRQMVKNEGRFNLVYQQEDTDPKGFAFQEVWFRGGTDVRGALVPGCLDETRRFGQAPHPADKGGPPLLSVATVDPSASNFWAILHILYYPNGDQVLYRGLRRRMTAPELIYREESGEYTGELERMWQASFAEHCPYRYLIVETRSQQRWLAQYEFITTWAARRGIVIIPHDPKYGAKTDPDLGVENSQRFFREGRVRIPYLGHEEKVFADQMIREFASWPEGETDDIVMAHWFFAYHFPRLAAVEEAMAEPVVEEKPPWTLEREPGWVSEMVS